MLAPVLPSRHAGVRAFDSRRARRIWAACIGASVEPTVGEGPPYAERRHVLIGWALAHHGLHPCVSLQPVALNQRPLRIDVDTGRLGQACPAQPVFEAGGGLFEGAVDLRQR